MPRTALRCVTELHIQAITAPGVWLPNTEDVYLSISLFGQYRNTRLLPSVFPLYFDEKFKFEKTYYTAVDPSEVSDFLEDELIIFELVQLSDRSSGATRLATFSSSARDFLYPYPSLAPCYSSADRVLLCRTTSFPGIAPKLEFTSKTVIKDSFSSELDALSDALEEEKYVRNRSRSHSRQRCQSRSLSPTRQRSRSRSVCMRVAIPVPRSRSISPRQRLRHSSAGSCSSDEDRPQHYMKPTVASIFHSRSPSPSVLRQIQDINICDVDVYPDPRPPFVVRHLSKDLIGRIPGTTAEKPKFIKSKGKRKRVSSTNGSYRKTLPGDYNLDYVTYPSLKHTYHLREVIRDPYDEPLPVFTNTYWTGDDDDGEVAALTFPLPSSRSRSRTRSISPLLCKPSYRERFSDRPITPTVSQQVTDRVAAALRRNRSLERLDRLSPPLSRSLYLHADSIDDLELDSYLARNRRSPVHLDDGHYWNKNAAEYQGKPHRHIFYNNTSSMNSNLHRTACNGLI